MTLAEAVVPDVGSTVCAELAGSLHDASPGLVAHTVRVFVKKKTANKWRVDMQLPEAATVVPTGH